jgi:molybdopterin synthase sulfur carrier subunit
MLTVRFFASLRERLGTGELKLAWHAGLANVEALIDALGREHGPRWQEALAEPNLIVARNHAVAGRNSPLAGGDEIAFYPPVTGG